MGFGFHTLATTSCYPGSRMPRIDSNDKTLNPNVTVLEWLHRQPSFKGKVAAYASWELLPWILNEQRSGVPSNGEGPPIAKPTDERQRAINEFAADLPPYWGSTRFDAPTGIGAIEYLKTHRPRVLYVMLGETDEWAHGRKYDLYLDAAWRNDRFVRRLWETAQAMPRVREPHGAHRLDRPRPRRSDRRTGPATVARFPSPIESGSPSWDRTCPASASAPA